MKAGIIGLPGVGKRTLFTLLTQVGGASSARTAQIGILRVPDPRLTRLSELHDSKKTTPATIEFVLIPGIAKGESKEQLDLQALRNVDVLVHLVRAFEEPSVPHPEGSIDPKRDVEMMELELSLADLGVVERRLERWNKDQKKGTRGDPKEKELLERAKIVLEEGKPLRAALNADERDRLRGYALLTAKPILLVVNVDESQAAEPALLEKFSLGEFDTTPLCAVSFVSARIESEIAELSAKDAKAFRDDLGLAEGMLERVVRAAFDLMGVITFYTASDTESRAWIIPKDTKAAAAAGTIHSDMERGFIRAEVVAYDVLVSEGSWKNCRDKGLLRLEGKDYPVAEADGVFFRFNV